MSISRKLAIEWRRRGPSPGQGLIVPMFVSVLQRATGGIRNAMPMLTRVLPFSSSAAGLDTAMRPLGPKGRSRKSTAGVLSIRNTWNNTLVTISDMEYKVKGWMTAGAAGFKKSKRSSYFAMEKCLSEAFLKARSVSTPSCQHNRCFLLACTCSPQHLIISPSCPCRTHSSS